MNHLVDLRDSSNAALCLTCGKCSSLCPLNRLADGLEGFGGRFATSRAAALRTPWPLRGAARAAIDRCLTCGACERRCPQGVHFSDFVRGVRGAQPADAAPSCPHGALFASAARRMAEPEPPRRDLAGWLGDDLEVATEGEVALFIGCLPLFDLELEDRLATSAREIARAAVTLLNRAGITPVVVAEERCCGHDLLWSGDVESFTALARGNAATFAARGVRHIVTPCAECARTWRLDYPEVEPAYQPRVEHLSEFLAAALADGRLVARSPAARTGAGDTSRRVTFHDPCRLGRHLGVTDAPRQLLAGLDAVELAEMEHSGLDARCCGTAGFIRCDAASRQLQQQRLDEAVASGADQLLTACPKCLLHLTCAQVAAHTGSPLGPKAEASGARHEIDVVDLGVFAAAHLTSPRPPGEPS